MNILLLGYGKMGQKIDALAQQKGHSIIGRINDENRKDLSDLTTDNIDVAIEFSQPDAAPDNIRWCFENGIPVAVGTTGWLDQKETLDKECKSSGGTYLYASNFSIGVNLFFKLNDYLAQLMQHQGQYDIFTKEIHHTAKKDAPSGTAITLAEGILKHFPYKTHWLNEKSKDPKALSIVSERIDPTPGTHEITYFSAIDSIEIRHIAHSREGFATGALAVAEWLKDQKGVRSMEDYIKDVMGQL